MKEKSINKLPKNWAQTQLGEIIQPSKEKINPLNTEELRYVGLEHIEKDTGQLLGYGSSKEVKSTKSKFSNGDLLYGKLRPYLNKVHLVDFEGICSTDILVFNKQPFIANQFLGLRFLSKDFVEYANQNVNGVQHPRVSFDALSQFNISLPPLNEQKRIVTKIEALQTRSSAVKEELEAIKPLLNQFRQSVLASAFRGDLTKDWREQNPDVEPAEVLLERIKVERRRRWEEAELEKMKAKGKVPKDDKWKKKYKEPQPIDTEGLPGLPDSWCWVSIEQISELVTDGDHNPPKKADRVAEGIPHLTVKHVIDWQLTEDDCDYITDQDFERTRKRYDPRGGDILITCIGTLGRTAIVPDDYIFNADRNIAIVRLISNEILSRFFMLCLNTAYSQKRIDSVSRATAQSAFYLSQIRIFPVVITSIEEQIEIVRRIESLFKLADSIEQQYQQAEVDLETLNQSILAKAFRGELVPQDPNDEPASVLLERIKEERDKAKTTAKKSKTRKKRSSKKKSSKKKDEQLGIPGM